MRQPINKGGVSRYRSPRGASRPESVGRGGPRGLQGVSPCEGASVSERVRGVAGGFPLRTSARQRASEFQPGFICLHSIHRGYRRTIVARLHLPIEEKSYCDIFPLMPSHTLLDSGSHIRQSKEVGCATSTASF